MTFTHVRGTALVAALVVVLAGGLASAEDSTPDPARPTDSGASAPAAGSAGSDVPGSVPGSVKVVVRSDAGTDAAAQAVTDAGGQVLARIEIVGGVSAQVPAGNVEAMRARADVQEVTPDAILATPVADAAGGADFSVTPAQAGHLIGADPLTSRGIDGGGVDVAVLDTGTVPTAGLDGPNKLVQGADLSFDSQLPGMLHLDAYGHGTHMASIIGGSDAPGTPEGFRGVAPGARIVSVKVGAADGAVDVSQVLAGIDWVVQHRRDNGLNVRVLNISFGTSSTQPRALDPLVHAAEVAWRAGIVVVASVGNDGLLDHSVADPASAPSVIAVGAADTRGSDDPANAVVADYSSRGTGRRSADVVAPGTHVLGLRVPGSFLDSAFPTARRGDRLFRGTGTSQATAVTSGAVALLLQARPELTPDQVKALLTGTARRIPGWGKKLQGSGLLDLAAAAAAATPTKLQKSPATNGTGSLELARGNTHVVSNGVVLTGPRDIFGRRLDTAAWAAASTAGNSWSGGMWNGNSWSGNSWSGNSWSGNSWSGNSWSGNSWSGNSWSGNSWSGNSWSGNSWSGNSWSGNSWSGNSWSGNSWSGNSWSGGAWLGHSWD